MLGFGDDPPRATPAILRRVEELREHSGGRLGLHVLLLGLRHLGSDLFLQTRILRQSEDVVDALALAPGHQFLPAEARIPAQLNLHQRPALANARHQRLQFLDRIGGGIDVGHPQAGT